MVAELVDLAMKRQMVATLVEGTYDAPKRVSPHRFWPDDNTRVEGVYAVSPKMPVGDWEQFMDLFDG